MSSGVVVPNNTVMSAESLGQADHDLQDSTTATFEGLGLFDHYTSIASSLEYQRRQVRDREGYSPLQVAW